jgi:hypothetical protein
MRGLDSSRYWFGIFSIVAILAGCGGNDGGTVPMTGPHGADAAIPAETSYQVLHDSVAAWTEWMLRRA